MQAGPIGFDDLLALVEERSSAPVARLAPGLAVTLCPACLADGRHEVLVIRRGDDGRAFTEDCAE
jgi:hypothetical protein